MKKGQVTIFIIIAMLIVAGIVLFFAVANIQYTKEPVLIDTDSVYSYTESYIENVARDCLEKIGKQGGYYEIPREIKILDTAYWYYEGINIQPFLVTLENETNKCVTDVLKNTTDIVLGPFNKTNSVEIDKERITSKIKIYENFVNVDVYYPISISKGDATSLVYSFETSFRINFYKLYELATEVVNYASLPDFDKCEPVKCSSDDINFTFFNEKDDLIIKGQTFLVRENNSYTPYELKFAIKRPIKEAFGENKKHLAVLYQEDKDLPTFGDKSIKLLSETLEIQEGVDFYDCDNVPKFFDNINKYDVIIITGNLQFQIIKYTFFDSTQNKNVEEASELPSSEAGELLYGCNSFNPSERKIALKNWVNHGGILWINNVAKAESDNFVISYLGSLGYDGGKWDNLGSIFTLEALQNSLLSIMEKNKEQINSYEITAIDHPILSCPNDITKELEGTGYYNSLKVTDVDEVLVGDKNSAKLWTRNLGKGVIVFDEFVLKDNLYNSLNYNDDIESKELDEKYFVNVLNYISKFTEYSGIEGEINLIDPTKDDLIEKPLFIFNSKLPEGSFYTVNIVDISGKTISIKLNQTNLVKTNNKFEANLIKSINLTQLGNGRYEWSVEGKFNNTNYFSNIDSFTKFKKEEINNNGTIN
ncbi:hypothetical protein J4205_02325 [Candidatus Pacearchaeota archaeon]|nr:hypothetical protein [Candidatus Pacearchaeota archaeon]